MLRTSLIQIFTSYTFFQQEKVGVAAVNDDAVRESLIINHCSSVSERSTNFEYLVLRIGIRNRYILGNTCDTMGKVATLYCSCFLHRHLSGSIISIASVLLSTGIH